MRNQFGLTAYPENAVLIDLAAWRIVYWIEPSKIEVYFIIVDGGYSTSYASEFLLFNSLNLLLLLK